MLLSKRQRPVKKIRYVIGSAHWIKLHEAVPDVMDEALLERVRQPVGLNSEDELILIDFTQSSSVFMLPDGDYE